MDKNTMCMIMLWNPTNFEAIFGVKSEKTKKTNKFVRLFFGRIYGVQICLRFYLTFNLLQIFNRKIASKLVGFHSIIMHIVLLSINKIDSQMQKIGLWRFWAWMIILFQI